MSVFRNIRVYPQHGRRASLVTWEVADGVTPGIVHVAFSPTGLKPWRLLNVDAPIASEMGVFYDTELHMNSGAACGYYRLLLTNETGDNFSESVAILGNLTPREYGMSRAIMHREFTEMRVANGYPVWHCIPKTSGVPSKKYDPDTGELAGLECADTAEEDSSYGLPFIGGFNPPVLTWIRALSIDRGTIKDSESEMSPRETDTTAIRMLAFPRPSRGHMIVDPATDRRYLIGDEIKPFLLRGILPIAYEATMQFLTQGDARYRFPVLPLSLAQPQLNQLTLGGIPIFYNFSPVTTDPDAL
jgi:hypothetical protein